MALMWKSSIPSFQGLKVELEYKYDHHVGLVAACPAISIPNKSFRTIWAGLIGNNKHTWSHGSSSFINTYGVLSDRTLFAVHKNDCRMKVQVAADYPDSRPDAVLNDLGYHPLEDVSSFEMKNIGRVDRRLTDAEITRTLAEANEIAAVFASTTSDPYNSFGIEVPYIVDEHGDFYFLLDNASEFLTALNASEASLQVIIGYENAGDLVIPEEELQTAVVVEDMEQNEESDDEPEKDWTIFVGDSGDYAFLEEADNSSESLGDWSGLETLSDIHPLDFAGKLSEASASDRMEPMDRSLKQLRIVGEVRRVAQEEESYVQQIWMDRFGWEDEYDDDDDDDADDESTPVESIAESFSSEASPHEMSASSSSEMSDDDNDLQDGTDSGTFPLLNEGTDISESGSGSDEENIAFISSDDPTLKLPIMDMDDSIEAFEWGASFYKLEIKNIQLMSSCGNEASIKLLDFQQAKPDVLAQSSAAIIERLNLGGKKLQNSLKGLCERRKGICAEKVSLIGLDSLGLDLRVHSGREVRNLRISFRQRATGVENAEKLLRQLLYPCRRKARRRHRYRSQKNF